MSKSKKERRTLVDKESKLSMARQCELLDIHRSGVYYRPKGETDLNLELMRLIDEKNMLHPWLGVPRIVTWLNKDLGYAINKKRIERLFRLMGLSATGPKPNTSKRGKGELHRVFKYLLKNLDIEGPDHVWAMDITYVPVQGGYLYLCAIIDVYSRYVVGWSLSNTMTAEWCKRILEAAIERHGAPEILNTDQGSQFTSREFTEYVTGEKDIRLSMDGKGRCLDNIFVERLWRSVKYEHVYLFPADDGLQCYRGLEEYFEYYNDERRHQSLDDEAPSTVYQQSKRKAA